MSPKYFTTGQAAIRCSVSPDTVLKWIRSGLLPARRTAGGHHRIDEIDLERILNEQKAVKENAPSARPRRRFQYCWEYKSKDNVLDGCSKCAVYLLRAQRCYDVAKFAPKAFHPKIYCKEACEDCNYFKEVHGQTTNVLVVTDDSELTSELKNSVGAARFNLETAHCEYACSMVVTHFKPDFAIIDCSLGQEASREITNHLVEDPRVPFVRVVLAANEGEFPNECEKLVFARLKRPFDVNDINECIEGMVTEHPEQN